MACGFNFKTVYGEYGEGYIQIHHINPVSKFDQRERLIQQQSWYRAQTVMRLSIDEKTRLFTDFLKEIIVEKMVNSYQER